MNQKILTQLPSEDLAESRVENLPATPSGKLPKPMEEKVVGRKRREISGPDSSFAGTIIGKLTAVCFIKTSKSQGFIWEFKCECGNVFQTPSSAVRSGKTKSCGCQRHKNYCFRCERHGLYGTKEYRTWCHIVGRCHNPNNSRWKDYGGRGISVSDNWRNSFLTFLKEMGNAPSPKHSIDRINNDGNYEFGNCRWATASEQYANKRSNVNITYKGETRNIADWAKFIGMDERCLRARIKRKWSIERAFTVPPQVKTI